MRSIIEELTKGNADIVGYFVACRERWDGILKNAHSVSVEELAERLSKEQFYFENICGNDRALGKVIMPWSGFATLYSCQVGYRFDDGPLAYKLSQAFAASTCSGEVKFEAKKAADVYFVSDFA
ncbi:hypothetical protein EDC30_102204 [Paucimonas lemoignei]|uniref:Uncharacterized protein n=1 Tax=Paucimonas lemoignei TaxID=29443 RepID=A0A4R3I1I5_PAULE|nr:hypothetical protein [Paucimonas lemoignei]TCS38465.1 hypothetical protein EDC30_102204 [Paucimonas lemoignei]